MGRLFWKFFLAFWLALLIAGVSVGTLVLFVHNQDETTHVNQAQIDEHAAGIIDILVLAAHYGGDKALTEAIKTLDHGPLPTFYAIDQSGLDILGRTVDSQLIADAKRWQYHHQATGAVITIKTNKHQYLVFAVRSFPPFSKSSATPFQATNSQKQGHHPPPDLMHQPLPRPLFKWLFLIIGTLASLFFSAALAWYFFKPISYLRNAFKAVSNGDLTSKVSPVMANRTDELADLGKSFDAMTGKIATLLKSQQRLLHDVSHEVRSPLARIQAAIGLAQQQPDKTNSMLNRIELESQRISDLVGELLILSKLESGAMTLQMTDFDFSDLVTSIINNAKFEAQAKQISVVYNEAAKLNYYGNRELLHRAIENIVRNALKFTPEHKTVIITLAINETDKTVVVTVEDNGPGVAEQDLLAIFNPFFRSEHPFRHDGIGLGLSIAHSAISAHGGIIHAQNRNESGLKFEIRLPINNENPQSH